MSADKHTEWIVKDVHGTPTEITMTIQTANLGIDPELLVEMLKGRVHVFIRPEDDTSPLVAELLRIRETFELAYVQAFGAAVPT